MVVTRFSPVKSQKASKAFVLFDVHGYISVQSEQMRVGRGVELPFFPCRPREGDGVLFVRAFLRRVLPLLRAGRRQRWPLEWRRPHEVRRTRIE